MRNEKSVKFTIDYSTGDSIDIIASTDNIELLQEIEELVHHILGHNAQYWDRSASQQSITYNVMDEPF